MPGFEEVIEIQIKDREKADDENGDLKGTKTQPQVQAPRTRHYCIDCYEKASDCNQQIHSRGTAAYSSR